MIAPVVLTETAKKVWEAVRAGPKDVADVVQTTQLDQSLVMVAALEAQQQGFFDVKERVRLELDPVPGAAARLRAI